MPIGMIFWVVFLIVLIFGFWGRTTQGGPYWVNYNGWVLMLLLFLLGWGVFGFAIYR
jgi:hypothetical protein